MTGGSVGNGPGWSVGGSEMAELGHEVAIGTRRVVATMARTEPDNLANPSFPVWASGHPEIDVSRLTDATANDELVVDANNPMFNIGVVR